LVHNEIEEEWTMEVRKYLAVMLVGMMVVSGLGIVSVGMNTVTPVEKDAPILVEPKATVPRVSLVEDFTGWNCAPCAAHNPAWTGAINAVGYTKVAPAYTHVWWPTAADDPMYMYCEGITGPQGDDNSVANRVATHGVGWAPWACVDGTQVDTGLTQAEYVTMFNAAAALPARVAITTSGYVNTGGLTATINARAEAVDELEPGNYRMMIYLWENPVTGVGSGTNAETTFNWAVWRMMPNGMGTDLGWSAGAHAGDSMSVSYTVPIEATWNVAELGGTIFVQNFNTLAVEQAAVQLFSAPQVTLTTPDPVVSEQVLSGNVNINWVARDTQDAANTLDIAIDYSINGGVTWNPIMSGTNNNNPPYVWNTALYPDSPHYELRVRAIDSAPNTVYTFPSKEYFTVDNTINDRWYLQTENTNMAGYKDLNMKPSEKLIWNSLNRVSTPAETFTDISGAGEFTIQQFASNPIVGDAFNIAGTWTFSINAKTGYCNPVPNGNLYAKIYAHNGVTSRLLATTGYDDEFIGTFPSYHTFSWTYAVPTVNVLEGEYVVVEILLHATSGTNSALFLNTARSDIKVESAVINDYTDTMISDNIDESIIEITNYATRYVNQPFTSTTFPPTGWQVATTGTTGTWSRQDANNAGGIKPEARFMYGATGTGTSRFYCGPIDTTGQTSLDFGFNTFFDAYAAGVTVKVQTSTNGVTWIDSGWSIVGGTANFGPARVTEVLTTADSVGSATLYIAFVVDGNSYNLDYWYVDDVVLGRDLTSMLEHKWTINVPIGKSPYQFNLEASRVAGTDNDNFQFSYSTDDVSYTNMVLVNAATDTTYTYGLPAGLPATVYIKVVDTVRSAGSTAISQVDVDYMYISSTSASQVIIGYDHYTTPSYVNPVLTLVTDVKPVITLLTPAPGTANQIIGGTYAITWIATDAEDAANTLDIKIEYSANGGTSWTVLEDGLNNNDGTYSWNTGALADNINYKVRVTVMDSIPHGTSDSSDVPFSIDNIANDRWYLQVQTTGANNRLNMMPVDVGPNSKASSAITGVGQTLIGTWQTDALTSSNINGAWDFSLYGMSSSNIGTGYLYASVYRSTGPTLLDTTIYDDENVFAFTSQHLFTWTDTLAGALTSGEYLLVEVWVSATAVPTSETLNTAGTTAAGGPHDVWFCDVVDNSQVQLTAPTGGTTVELTDAFYTAASTTNDLRAGPSANPGATHEIFVKCSFITTATPAFVSAITFTYEAQYSAANEVVTIYAWNYVTSLWVAVGTTMTFTTAATDYTMTRSIASGYANYISGGIILWGVYGSIRATCSVDFLQVQITMAPSTTVSLNIDYAGSESFIEPTLGGGVAPTAYNIDLTAKSANSWVFVSFPRDITGSIQTILNDAALGDGMTTWTVAKWYNPQTPLDPWKTYRVGSTVNDMPALTNAMGVWLWITLNGGDQMLTTGVTGSNPGAAVNINLYTGWNMVGYPTATSRAESATLPAAADLVASWQLATPFITEHAKGATLMVPGNAYWVHVTADCTWSVAP
jgi:hypothetical protein